MFAGRTGCRVRLVDEMGCLWESVSLFTPEFFFEKMVDMGVPGVSVGGVKPTGNHNTGALAKT